jgi:transposase InsO family protein
MADQKAETVMNTLIDSIILEYGVPERVLTDQGTNFLSQTMDTGYQQLGIKRLRTTAYKPCCDGMVESFNRTMADMIASYVINQPDTWDNYIKYATFAYNTSVHSSLGYTLFYLLKGFEAREPNDVLPAPRFAYPFGS